MTFLSGAGSIRNLKSANRGAVATSRRICTGNTNETFAILTTLVGCFRLLVRQIPKGLEGRAVTPPGAPIKWRVCTCCGESKRTTAFSHQPKTKKRTETCRDCGVWLYLFRRVFPKPRDLERNRQMQRIREEGYRVTKRPINQAGVNLWNAWNGRL